ncbi:MAG: single-stranded DNA-binding protein [Thermoplasmata archaeon]
MEGTTKIKDLTPDSKRVNVLAKVVSIGETKDIQTRFGETKKLTEAVLGDDTGLVTMTLWGDQIGIIAPSDTVVIDNGYTSLVRGHLRLNIGKYGNIKKAEETVENINNENDMSAQEHEQTFRHNNKRFQGNYNSGSSGNNNSRGKREFRPRRQF